MSLTLGKVSAVDGQDIGGGNVNLVSNDHHQQIDVVNISQLCAVFIAEHDGC